MSKFLISIIIPTRNRQQYAEAAVRQILSLNQDIQIIVHDNSDNNSLAERLSDVIKNEHIVYIHIEERIASIDNFEMAMSYVEGEYLVAIGDDDGILCNITDCVNLMKENAIDAIKPAATHYEFHWIDKNSSIERYRSGVFNTRYFTGKASYYDTKQSVFKLLERGGQGYSRLPMAGTYHRVVRMELFEKVKQITGRYYGGLSPDMYSSVCLSLIPNIRFAEFDFPISLPGICPSSTSAASVTGGHSGKLETAPHFIGLKTPYEWDERVPRYYSVETIWAETMIKAVVAMNRTDLIEDRFNLDYLIKSMYLNPQNSKNDIEELIGKEKIDSIHIAELESNDSTKVFVQKVQNYLIRRIPGNGIVNAYCENIEQAVSKMNDLIHSDIMQRKWNHIKSTLSR